MNDERLQQILSAIEKLPENQGIGYQDPNNPLRTYGTTFGTDDLHYLRERVAEMEEMLGDVWELSFGKDGLPDIAMVADGSWQACQNGIGYGEKFDSPMAAYRQLTREKAISAWNERGRINETRHA